MAGGDQPLDLRGRRRSPLIVNGEIYNHLDLRAELEAARPPLRHRLRLRGRRPRLRGARPATSCAQPERHLRLRALGRPRAAAWSPRATSSASSRSTGAATAAGLAVASEVGALLAAGLVQPRSSTAWRSTTTSRAASCPRPRTLFEGVSKLPAAVAAHRRAEGAAAAGRRAAARRPASRSPGRARRGARRRARRALHRRRRAPDDVRRPLRRLPVSGGVDSAAIVAAMAQRSAGSRPPRSRSASPATATCSTSARPPPRRARLIGTDHHDTAMVETDFLAELARCVPRLEEPCGIPSAPALLQLSRFAAARREGGARRPGRRRAARRLRPPPGRRAARRRAHAAAGARRRRPRRSPGRSRAPRAPGARPTCSAAAATRSGCCGWSRSPTRALRTRARPAARGEDAEAERLRARRGRARATSPAATCSSRRSTSTRACSCPTGS